MWNDFIKILKDCCVTCDYRYRIILCKDRFDECWNKACKVALGGLK